MLVTAAADRDLAAAARDDGRDLTFTSEGAPLPFELASFDGKTGAFEAWVRVPALAPSGATMIDLEYGGEPIDHDPKKTWQGVAGVWHMTLADGVSRDSGPNSYDMIAATPALAPTSVLGVAGSALAFDGVDDLLNGISGYQGLELGESYTVEVWVFVTHSVGNYDMPLYHGGASASYPGYDLELGMTNWSANLVDISGATQQCVFGVETLNRWVQLALVVDRSQPRVYTYVDSVVTDSRAIPALLSTAAPRAMQFSNPTYPFSGVIDEIRVYPEAKSASWFAAELENFTVPELVQIGPDEPL